VVGPKAANVGELNRLFPGRIAPALALPFGVFAAHTEAVRERLGTAYQRLRTGDLDQAALEQLLDELRAEVGAMQLRPELRAALVAAMRQEFGAAAGYGLFVRSDTNVEDLPEFTGAGLNETVPNVVGLDRQLAAIARVWSSIYTRRAMSWRSRILANPEAVFASVLLMRSVPSEKSGVLVTTDLVTGAGGITVSVAWGVGGAVDNESAASRVLRPDGSSLLLAEAKAPYQRVLAAEGGVTWLPAPTGPVLSADEQRALRRLASEVVERYPASPDAQGRPLPWDVEFAFAEGTLWLLQIRPLIQRGRVEADRVTAALLPRSMPADVVDLEGVPAGVTGDPR
jgi:phosphoenolpyruvate synthase/pyruvate phosphate dikinase